MTASRNPSRRGVALLVVLATLLVVGAVCASLAHTASAAILERITSLDMARADELRHAAERSVLRWLNTEADRVVLPPDIAEPMIPVLHDSWEMDGIRYSVRVAAWDQCGLVPLQLTGKGSPLRTILPKDLIELEDRPVPRDAVPGLDLWPGSVFPSTPAGRPSVFGGGRWANIAAEQLALTPDDARALRWGSTVATHNPDPGRRRHSPAATINMHTAPLPLLEAAMRELGRGGLELIVEARRRGRQARLPAPGGSAAADHGGGKDNVGDRLELAGFSHCWSFRLDVRAGLVERSWWIVYSRGPSSWELVQRLVIPC